jgi:hypothetical protein
VFARQPEQPLAVSFEATGLHRNYGRLVERKRTRSLFGLTNTSSGEKRSNPPTLSHQRRGFFLGGNSRYESAIALRTIHERFSRATGSSTRRLNNGGKRRYAKTIADSTAPTTLTIDPKREAKATSTTTKPRGTSTRNCEWAKTLAATRAAARLRRAPVIGRPTTTSVVRIDVTSIGDRGDSEALIFTVRVFSLSNLV